MSSTADTSCFLLHKSVSWYPGWNGFAWVTSSWLLVMCLAWFAWQWNNVDSSFTLTLEIGCYPAPMRLFAVMMSFGLVDSTLFSLCIKVRLSISLGFCDFQVQLRCSLRVFLCYGYFARFHHEIRIPLRMMIENSSSFAPWNHDCAFSS